MSEDGCLKRGSEKTAEAVTVYLMEELGDARLRCDELVRYVEAANKLIEKSAHRDQFFEVAGNLIQGIPATLFKLQKALQAVAFAASRIDYEELKRDLRPEKVEQLESILQDARIRQIRRRSEPFDTNPPSGVPMKLASKSGHDWKSHFAQNPGLMQLGNAEEVRKKFKAENPKLSDEDLDKIVGHWAENKDNFKAATLAWKV